MNSTGVGTACAGKSGRRDACQTCLRDLIQNLDKDVFAMSFLQDPIRRLVRDGATAGALVLTLVVVGLIALIIVTLLLIFSS
jgi:hypothetical protein